MDSELWEGEKLLGLAIRRRLERQWSHLIDFLPNNINDLRIESIDSVWCLWIIQNSAIVVSSLAQSIRERVDLNVDCDWRLVTPQRSSALRLCRRQANTKFNKNVSIAIRVNNRRSLLNDENIQRQQVDIVFKVCMRKCENVLSWFFLECNKYMFAIDLCEKEQRAKWDESGTRLIKKQIFSSIYIF